MRPMRIEGYSKPDQPMSPTYTPTLGINDVASFHREYVKSAPRAIIMGNKKSLDIRNWHDTDMLWN